MSMISSFKGIAAAALAAAALASNATPLAAATADGVAKINVKIEYWGGRSGCGVETAAKGKAVNVRGVPCSDGRLTLRTDASGHIIEGAYTPFAESPIRLNGSGPQFFGLGRSGGTFRQNNDIQRVIVRVRYER